MNPFPMVLADLRALRCTAPAIVLLVALAIATGVAIGAQERALRHGSATAANDFDLIIGAPGSQTQLLMSAVYLQPDALPLIDGRLLNTLFKDERVAQVAPIAFGDVSRGYPIVGTTAAFASRWDRIKPSEGRLFAAEGEAVLGADVLYQMSDTITPSHGVAGHTAKPGQADAEEDGHKHEGHGYTVVGRLPRLGSSWDRAILVPIESVWEVHGLGNGHASDEEKSDSPFWKQGSTTGTGPVATEDGIGLPFEGKRVPGVPAIVVKPKSVAGAYALRGQYRQGGTMAFFPAEVLIQLYQTLGDVRQLMTVMALVTQALVMLSIVASVLILFRLLLPQFVTLRAIGAPKLYIFFIAWGFVAVLFTAGVAIGLGAGYLLSRGLSAIIQQQIGIALTPSIGQQEMLLALSIWVLGLVIALLPAWHLQRRPLAEAMKAY